MIPLHKAGGDPAAAAWANAEPAGRDGFEGSAPVGWFGPATGICDLAGNAREWCRADVAPGADEPTRSSPRGGDFTAPLDQPEAVSAALTQRLFAGSSDAAGRSGSASSSNSPRPIETGVIARLLREKRWQDAAGLARQLANERGAPPRLHPIADSLAELVGLTAKNANLPPGKAPAVPESAIRQSSSAYGFVSAPMDWRRRAIRPADRRETRLPRNRGGAHLVQRGIPGTRKPDRLPLARRLRPAEPPPFGSGSPKKGGTSTHRAQDAIEIGNALADAGRTPDAAPRPPQRILDPRRRRRTRHLRHRMGPRKCAAARRRRRPRD
ncbi:MAG: hypothetical protein R3F11_07995 [Verrucomicrobiales bacterium]